MSGWVLGAVVGAVVVVVLVVVLVLMIAGARRTAQKAEQIVTALQQARDGTAALREVGTTVHTAERIGAAAAGARRALTPGGPT